MEGPEILIPITFFLTVGGVVLARGEIGKAIAHRIRGGSPTDESVHAELVELRGELEEVRRELAETQERVDFTERMLAQGRAPEQLPRG